MHPKPDDLPSSRPLETWTRLLAEGDEAAWRWFHHHHYLSLLRYAAHSCGNPSSAADILQQAYLRIARHAKPFTTESDFWNWLCCLVRCAALDHIRHRSRRSALMEEFAHWRAARSATDATWHPATNSPAALADEALASLPPEDAAMLRRKYCDGSSTAEIAAALGISAKAVEHRLARLRHDLRDIILRLQ